MLLSFESAATGFAANIHLCRKTEEILWRSLVYMSENFQSRFNVVN